MSTQQYRGLYHSVKLRLIDARRLLEGLHSLFAFEKAALQMRKTIETIAFSGLILSELQGKAPPDRLRKNYDGKKVFQ